MLISPTIMAAKLNAFATSCNRIMVGIKKLTKCLMKDPTSSLVPLH